MSLKTRIRFTEPVDPREVWAKTLEMIEPPDDYTWSYVPVGGNPIAWRNPLIFAEPGQGARIWAYVMYGPDGCKLVEDEEDICPPAFVELSLISDWTGEDLHDEIVVAMSRWRPGIMWRDEYQEWVSAF